MPQHMLSLGCFTAASLKCQRQLLKMQPDIILMLTVSAQVSRRSEYHHY